MRLHGHGSSGNVHKVRLLASWLGIPLEHEPTGFFDATRTPEFRALNPNGKVPVLVDDDFVVWESGAILAYLAHGTPLLPDERRLRAQVLQWMFFEQYSHEPFVATSRSLMHFQGPGPERDAALESKRAGANHALDVMENHLEGRHWFVGDGPTLADVALVSYTHVAHEGKLDLEPRPNIRAWVERVQNQAGWVDLDPFDGSERL